MITFRQGIGWSFARHLSSAATSKVFGLKNPKGPLLTSMGPQRNRIAEQSRSLHDFSFSWADPKSSLGAKLALRIPKPLLNLPKTRFALNIEQILGNPLLMSNFLSKLDNFTFDLKEYSTLTRQRFLSEMETAIGQEPELGKHLADAALRFVSTESALSPFFWRNLAKEDGFGAANELLCYLQTQGGELKRLIPMLLEDPLMHQFILKHIERWKVDDDGFFLALFKLASIDQRTDLYKILWEKATQRWDQAPPGEDIFKELLTLDRKILEMAPKGWILKRNKDACQALKLPLLELILLKNECSFLEEIFLERASAPSLESKEINLSRLAKKIEERNQRGDKNTNELELLKKFFRSNDALFLGDKKGDLLFLGTYFFYANDKEGVALFLEKLKTLQTKNRSWAMEQFSTLVKLNQSSRFPNGVASLLNKSADGLLEPKDQFSLMRFDDRFLEALFLQQKDPFGLIQSDWDRKLFRKFFDLCQKRGQKELLQNLNLNITNLLPVLDYFFSHKIPEFQEIFAEKLQQLSDLEQIEFIEFLASRTYESNPSLPELSSRSVHPKNPVRAMSESILLCFLKDSKKHSPGVRSSLFRLAAATETGLEKFSEAYKDSSSYTRYAKWTDREVDLFLELLDRQNKLGTILEQQLTACLIKSIPLKILSEPFFEKILKQGKSAELALFIAEHRPGLLAEYIKKAESFFTTEGSIDEDASKLLSKVKDLVKFENRSYYRPIISLWCNSVRMAIDSGQGSLTRGWNIEFPKMGKFFVFFPMLFIQKWDGYASSLAAEKLKETLKRSENVLKSGETHVMDNLLGFMEFLDRTPIDPLKKIRIIQSIFDVSTDGPTDSLARFEQAKRIVTRISMLKIFADLDGSKLDEIPVEGEAFLVKMLPFLEKMPQEYKRLFSEKILNDRVRGAWFRYYSGAVEKAFVPRFLELTDRMVMSTNKARYNTIPFQEKWKETNSHVWEKWKQNREFVLSDSGTKIEFTDDPVDLFLSGDEVHGSCMHTSKKNPHLLHYTNEGVNKLIAVKNSKEKIEARALLRLVWNQSKQKPAFFLEPAYGDSFYHSKIRESAKKLAEDFEVELFSQCEEVKGALDPSLIMFESPEKLGWSDSIGVLIKREFLTLKAIHPAAQCQRMSLFSDTKKGEDRDWFLGVLVLMGLGVTAKNWHAVKRLQAEQNP